MADGHIEFLIGARADRSLDAIFGSVPKKAEKARAGIDRAFGTNSDKAFKGFETASSQASARMVSEQTRAVLQVARMREREQRRAEAQQIASERRVLAEKAKAANAELAQNKRVAAESARAEQRAHADRQRAIDRQVRSQIALDRQRRTEEARSARQARAFEDSFAYRTAYHGVIRYLPGALHRGARFANDLVRGAGVDMDIGASMRRNVETQGLIREIRNQAILNDTNISTADIDRRVRGAALKAGYSSQEVARGIVAFGKTTGDSALGLQMAPELLRRAAIGNTSPEQMMALGGDIASHLGENVKDKVGATLAAIDMAIAQGARGAVEIEDMTKLFPTIGAAAGAFEGPEQQNMARLGALVQLARRTGGARNPAEAVTAVGRFKSQLTTAARVKQFQAADVDIYSKAEPGKLRDPLSIIRDSITKTGGDPLKLNKMFMSTVGIKPVEALRRSFIEARNAALEGGATKVVANARGTAAMDRAIEDMTNVRGIESKIDLANKERDSEVTAKAARFTETFDQVTQRMMATTLPALEKAGPSAIKIAELLGKAAGWAAENPLKAFGAALAASIARAGIESAVRAGLEKLIASGVRAVTGGGGGGAAIVGGGPTKGGTRILGSAMVGLAIGVPLADALEKTGKENFDVNTSEAAKASRFLAEQSGSGIELGISNARNTLAKLKADKTSAFFDLFGAGNGADIAMLENLISRKEIELRAFRASPATDSQRSTTAKGQATATPAQSGPMPVVIDQGAMSQAMSTALRSGTIRVEVTNLPPPGNNTAADPPTHGPAGRGKEF